MEMALEVDACELSAGPEERDFLSQLHDLDSGLADTNGNTAVRLVPALEARLMLPSLSRESRFRKESEELPFLMELRPVQPTRQTPPAPRRSPWLVSLSLILLVLLGEAGAVLVLHERVSHAVSHLAAAFRQS